MLTRNDIENHLKDDLTGLFGKEEGNAIIQYLIHWWSKKKLIIDGWPELESIKKRILNQEPVQYVAGWTEFAGLELALNGAVLIPRPETEELVYLIKENLEEKSTEHLKLLDIGTGSGCIALALKKFFPLWGISATDVSQRALHTASSNAELNGLEIDFLHMDMRAGRVWSQYDVIVSNPPYVTEKEKQNMQVSVTGFEPHEALFVSNDEDPLLFYKAIIGLCREGLLKRGGYLFFEVHYHYGTALPEYMTGQGFAHVELLKDLSGNYRFISGRYF
jgi:release factor glutamine methyltransferase